MEEKKYTVYMHENKINHKRYIGITCQDPEARWQHGTGYRSCTAMNRAFIKYGWDGFKHIILYTGLSKEEACQKEIQLIEEYHTRDSNFGYNICVGGVGTSGCVMPEEVNRRKSELWKTPANPNYKGKIWTPEFREYMRKINTGKKLSEETKRKISEGCRGKIHHSDEFKQRLAERNKHSVERDDGIIFNSVNEAAESVGVSPSAISNSMRRKTRSGGYYWKLAELKA